MLPSVHAMTDPIPIPFEDASGPNREPLVGTHSTVESTACTKAQDEAKEGRGEAKA